MPVGVGDSPRTARPIIPLPRWRRSQSVPPNWESRHLDGESKKVYELDKGHTSNAKNAAWVRWCRARKLNYGATVPDVVKIKSAAFENLVYDPVKEGSRARSASTSATCSPGSAFRSTSARSPT